MMSYRVVKLGVPVPAFPWDCRKYYYELQEETSPHIGDNYFFKGIGCYRTLKKAIIE